MKKFLKVSAIGLSFILMFVMLVACGEGSLPIDNPQQPVDALNNDTYSITYSIAGSDRYLAEQNINNANPEFYTVSQGLVLQNISVPGYNFKGWYTHETGGDRITEIAAGTKGAKELFAQWEEIEYTINFDSPDVPMESKTYKVSTGATLQKPSWFGYTFVGWSIDGKLVNSIPVGTTGNITLHANWTSERNKATAVTQLEDPSVIEDMHNGQYIFIYEIGSIQNVPLALLKDLANSEGIEVVVNEKFSPLQ